MTAYAIHLTNGFRLIIHSFYDLARVRRSAQITWPGLIEEVRKCR